MWKFMIAMKYVVPLFRLLILLLFCISGAQSLSAEEIPKGQLLFIENKGQIIDQVGNLNPAVRYLFNSIGFNVQLRKEGFSYDVFTIERQGETNHQSLVTSPQSTVHCAQSMDTNDSQIRFHRIDFNFEGANPDCKIIAEDPSSNYLNYYTTGTPEEGITEVRHYGKVTYRDLYPGIDLECLSGVQTRFKYNFIVKPGADMGQIRMRIDGATEINETDGNLTLHNSINTIEEKIPASFFSVESETTEIQVEFHNIHDNLFGFSTSTEIPADAILIIDPVPDIVWGTYYGGASLDYMFDCALGTDGNLYTGGYTYSPNNIASTGSFQFTIAGIMNHLII